MKKKPYIHLPKFFVHDVMQMIVGATVLAVPIAFTQEAWDISLELPVLNIILIVFFSILFLSMFSYYNYYKNTMRNHWREFINRVFATYMVSFIVVGFLLFLLNKAQWTTEFAVALKRTIIVSFPASMSAAVSDVIK